MQLEVWLTYVAACLILTATPGPSIFLGMIHSLNYGVRNTLYTALGDISANFIQMMLVAIGLGAIVAASETAFLTIKWFGVVTLCYLGLKMILSKETRGLSEATVPVSAASAKKLYIQGFMVAAGNPKAIVFFTAFFPQFIDPDRSLVTQMAIMCPTMALLDFFWVMFYSLSAKRMATTFRQKAGVINKGGGAVLVGAALFMAFAKRD